MADVTMNLAELDTMRENIKNLEKKVEEKQEEITRLESLEKQVRIRKYKKYVPKKELIEALRNLTKRLFYKANSKGYNNIMGLEDVYTLKESVMRGLEWDTSKYVTEEESQSEKEYINFDDVVQELRQDAEKKVSEELGKLRSQVSCFQADMSTLEEMHKKEIENLKKENLEEIKTIKEEHIEEIKEKNKLIEKLKEDYKALKEDKDTRTKEEKLTKRILELEEEIEKINKKRGFWDSWFQ